MVTIAEELQQGLREKFLAENVLSLFLLSEILF